MSVMVRSRGRRHRPLPAAFPRRLTVRHLLRTSGVVTPMTLLAVGLLPAFQTPQKPVRTYGIRALVPPGGQEPEALYVSADAVLLVRVESSKSFLGKSG